ncbi:MAG TPA: ABC transporter ATP-binding protein [Sphingomicrobium sp.]|nr:ABC transporter ATP-binding protein [Sphingomicrobium sp.]
MTPLLDAAEITLHERLGPTNLQVDSGQFVAVIGPNGSGKTSLLRALADVERTTGDVRIGGEELTATAPARRPYLATYLPASRDLVWPIAARDVIALGLPQRDKRRVDELIEKLELEQLADRPVDRLSTGERARVLFARALAPRPQVLLLDEPLSNLDPYWVLKLLQILRETVSDGTSALVALHDIDRVVAFDRALLIAGGEIRADLSPGEMLASAALEEAFRIHRSPSGWEVSCSADPRSSR